MNSTDVAERPAGTEVTVFVADNPVAVLTDQKKRDAFYERVKAEVEKHTPDLTTKRGRDAIASLAFKVVKTKTALDEAGKKLTEDKRAEITAVDDARRAIRQQFDALRDAVRRPLTDWETAEEARAERCKTVLANLKALAVIAYDDSSEAVADRLDTVEATIITKADFADSYEFAVDTRANAIAALTAGIARLQQEERDRAELARLRREAEERAAEQEAERAAAAEAARIEAEARAAEAAKAEAERAAAERERQAEETRRQEAEAQARAAADEARAEAERLAESERATEREAHELELEAQRQARAAAEAEAQRLADEQAERERQAAETRRAEEARAKDRAHRGTIMSAAKEALMEHVEIDEPLAKRIVLAIAAGSIPAVQIQY